MIFLFYAIRPSSKMDAFKEGWFTEIGAYNTEGTNLSIKNEEVIYETKSNFQNILVFQRYCYY